MTSSPPCARLPKSSEVSAIKQKESFRPFSKKQMKVFCWWHENSDFRDYDAIICDGAVRSGKTFSMCLSFCIWATLRKDDCDFALCGKTIASLRRNIVTPVLPALRRLRFEVREKLSKNVVEISAWAFTPRFPQGAKRATTPSPMS